MHRPARLNTFLIALLLAVGGCSSSGLSRGKAKNVIDASTLMANRKTEIYVDKDELKRGQDSGLWVSEPRGIVLTDEGKKYFSWLLLGMASRRYYLVSKVQLPSKVVDVTGIADMPMMGPSVKQVDFTWNYEFRGFPASVRSVFENSAPESGRAILHLYDDGWRVESISAGE